jgi:hypothetical protein
VVPLYFKLESLVIVLVELDLEEVAINLNSVEKHLYSKTLLFYFSPIVCYPMEGLQMEVEEVDVKVDSVSEPYLDSKTFQLNFSPTAYYQEEGR